MKYGVKVDKISQAQDRVQKPVVLNTITNRLIHKRRKISVPPE